MSRRGRPRQPGARKASGDLKRKADEGSPYLLAQRARAVDPTLAGVKVVELAKYAIAKDRHSSYPLGVLLLRQDITSGQHYAGCRYAGLFVRAVRGVSIPSCLANLTGSIVGGPMRNPDVVDEIAVEVQAAYRDARALLERAGRRVVAAVDEIAVYESLLPASVPFLRFGLDVLKRHFNEIDSGRVVSIVR